MAPSRRWQQAHRSSSCRPSRTRRPCRAVPLARSLSARRAKEASVTPLLQAPRALALSAVAFRTEHGCGAQGRCSLQQSVQTERCWAAWAALGAELWPAADGSRCGQRRAAPGVAQDRYAQRSGAVLGLKQGFVRRVLLDPNVDCPCRRNCRIHDMRQVLPTSCSVVPTCSTTALRT